MENDNPKISIMTFDDQFLVAEVILSYLDDIGVELNEEQEDGIIERVLAFTDEFSLGSVALVEID